MKQPEYSVIPRIFDPLDITFRKGNLQTSTPDTLIFRIKFADGDGDLGVSSVDSFAFDSYNPWFYIYRYFDIRRGPDNTAPIPTGYSFINYYAKRKIPQFDTLPALGCSNWELLHDSQGKLKDTIYIRQNLRAYNINVDVYTRDNSGVYNKFDPSTYFDLTGCAPNLSQTLKMDVTINDRAFHLSNTVEKKDFTLQQITK